jgi:UDP-N-acetylglucosamine 2-epimerase (non-hydrolysing)
VSSFWKRRDSDCRNSVYCPFRVSRFMALVKHSRIVLTDSGGLQEETTVLGIPCLTLRENTERPVTVTHGTNRIVGSSPSRIVTEAACILDSPHRAPVLPPLWDGHASERIVEVLRRRIVRAHSPHGEVWPAHNNAPSL